MVLKWSDLDGGRGSQAAGSKAIDRVKNRDYDGSIYMVNKPPRWNDQVRMTLEPLLFTKSRGTSQSWTLSSVIRLFNAHDLAKPHFGYLKYRRRDCYSDRVVGPHPRSIIQLRRL